MAKTFLIFALSFLVILPVLGGASLSFNVPVVHGQQLEVGDILSDDFGDSTGLGQASIDESIGRLIKACLALLGVVAVVIVLLAGFKWMTAAGNEDVVGESKKMLISAVIGLAIIVSAWSITEFAVSAVLRASS
ncbi:hypothetical protein A2258_01530 [Candidatus Uhrbacteria bacterium RIFOXYA2_FULL_41_8]|nr:MAG: hypothetical protein A2258_01530 [Candidatus Uhrbacteria bacterium RIFOXYA2_FULL_41_8]